MDVNFPNLPEPPYTVVIFSNQHSGEDDVGYEKMAQRMVELAQQQPGYLGMFSTRNGQGFGVTVSFWKDRESASAWKSVASHRGAQELGKQKWYAKYRLQIAEVSESRDGP